MYTCLANLESASLVRGQVQSCAMSTPVVFCLTVKYKSHAWRDVKRCRVGSQVVVLASLGVPHAGKRRGSVFSLFALRQGRACTKERIRYSGVLSVPLAF
jgi:hypothetical protein